MNYDDIITQLAIKENKSKQEIEKELAEAISYTDINCSAREFIFGVADYLKKTIYSNIV